MRNERSGKLDNKQTFDFDCLINLDKDLVDKLVVKVIKIQKDRYVFDLIKQFRQGIAQGGDLCGQ